MIIGKSGGIDIKLDLDRLLETRMFLCANSGAGKSWALRRIIEQTHGHVQQLIIDPEGEFRTLRERFDYLYVAGKDGDIPADPRSAPLLCRRLMELGASAILDLFDLEPKRRRLFVKAFLDALINLDKTLWHNALVVVDEVQMFAPESGESVALDSVINLMSMGRKRGFCGLLASQRISKVNKDAIAEANNYVIGRAALDIDMKRAADTLGFSRDRHTLLRSLPAGQFYVFGPAISTEVVEVQVGPVSTTHPKAGQRSAPTPPPAAKIQKLLGHLADLPKEAEQEAANLADANKKISDLQRQLNAKTAPMPATKPVHDPEALEKARAAGAESVKKILARELKAYGIAVGRLLASSRRRIEDARAEVESASVNIKEIVAEFQSADAIPSLPSLEGIIEEAKIARPVSTPTIATRVPARTEVPRREPSSKPTRETTGSLPKGELAVLTAACQYPNGVRLKQLTILTGYKRSSRDAYVQRLRERGLIEKTGDTILPLAGAEHHLGADFEPLPTGAALREYWLRELPEGERAVFDVLLEAGGRAVTRESIDSETGYKRSSRDAYIQRLKSRELVIVENGGLVRASEDLFSD